MFVLDFCSYNQKELIKDVLICVYNFIYAYIIIHMATVPINLDNETVQKLDTLVLQGVYKNRTEAIRDQIKKGLAQMETVIFPKKSLKYNSFLQRLLNEKTSLNVFRTTKSAVELVSEGRER